MSCLSEVKFLLKYYEKIQCDKDKMAEKIREFAKTNNFSKKSIDTVIITCELTTLYDLLDSDLISTLKREKRESERVLNKLDDFLSSSSRYYDPCSHSYYSGSYRGGC